MANQRDPQTLVRLGVLDSSLEGAVRNSREDLIQMKGGLGNSVKYGLLKEGDEPYLLMISQQRDILKSPAGYKVVLTITSYSDERNQDVAREFEGDTNLDLGLEVPELLQRQYNVCNMLFPIYEEIPEGVRAVWRGE